MTQPAAGGGASSGDLGPLYVLLINPATGDVVRSVLATRGSAGYTWAVTGWTLPSVQIVSGSDLDNDNQICQRGEACGAYPLPPSGSELTTVQLTGDRSDLNMEVAPLSGISAMATVPATAAVGSASKARPGSAAARAGAAKAGPPRPPTPAATGGRPLPAGSARHSAGTPP